MNNLEFKKDGVLLSKLEFDNIEISFADRILSFDPRPIIGDTPLRLTKWEGGKYSARAKIRDSNLWCNIEINNLGICYFLTGKLDFIDRLIYFPDTKISSKRWHTFQPDYNFGTFPLSKDKRIIFTSGTDPSIQKFKERTWMLMPVPRCVAFKITTHSWLGVSVPGILPVGETIFQIRNGKFSIIFKLLRLKNSRWQFPKVYFTPFLPDQYSALETYKNISEYLRLYKKKKPYYSWWSRPMFCSWGEQNLYKYPWNPKRTVLSPKNLLKWINIIEDKTKINNFTVVIDFPWFRYYGDFNPQGTKFGSTKKLRALIDVVKSKGHHVLLWFTPYIIHKRSDISRKCPGGILKDKSGKNFPSSFLPGFYRDYTHPGMRKHVKRIIEYCLSNKSNCLNADGLKVDFNFQAPIVEKIRYYNPDWGYGDQYVQKVMQFIYKTAHQVKNEAFISISAVEGYLQPYTDALRLNDQFEPSCNTWFYRARLGTTILKDTLIDVDAWSMSFKKYPHYWVVSPTYGIPITYEATGFKPFIFSMSRGKPVEKQIERWGDTEYKRLSSIWHVYSNAPVHPSMAIVIDFGKGIFYRKYTKGILSGFFAALCIKKSCLITYSKNEIRITSIRNMVVKIPLPKILKQVRIFKVRHDNREELIGIQNNIAGYLILKVKESAKDVLYYKISNISSG